LGLNQALIQLVTVGFSPAFQVGLRSACAFLPVLAFAFFMRRKLSLTDGTLPFGRLNGLLFSIEFCLMFIALDYTTVARASRFFYVMAVWVAIAAHFLVPGEELTLNKTLGLGCAIAGVTWALAGDLGDADANAWIGDAFALLAGMFWAAIAIVTRISRLSQVSPEMNLLYQLAVSAVLMIAIAPLFGAPIREPTIAIYAFFAFQVIVIVAIGFLLWFWILSIYPISNMASFSLLALGFGILFGWRFLMTHSRHLSLAQYF